MAKHDKSPPLKLSDREIVSLFFDRDERAVEMTERKYGSMMRKLAYSVTGNYLDAEECCNDALMRIWNSIPPNKPELLSAYATVVVKNVAYNKVRDQNTQARVPSDMITYLSELEEDVASPETPETEYLREESGKLLSRFIKHLPEDRQYVFIAYYYLSKPIREISSISGIPKSKVQRILEKTKAELRKYLKENGVEV